MNFKVGDFVFFYNEIVEIIDEEFIQEIRAKDYYIKNQSGSVFGPLDGLNFIPIENPNEILKDII